MDDAKVAELNIKKRYLKRYRKNRALIIRLEEKLASLDERIYSLRSPTLSDLPKGGVPVDLTDLLSDKQDLEARINKINKKGRDIKGEILDHIDDLEDERYADILEAFFIECKSFDEIAEEKGYNTRHVIRLYSEAILAMSL